MGIPVIIYGKSGAGKSRSLKNFQPNEITLLAVENKPLPFRNSFTNRRHTPTMGDVVGKLAKAPTKTVVIDDAGYLMTHHFMSNHRNKAGNASFAMYDDIADGFYTLVQTIQSLAEDVIVYIVMHEETNDFGDTKLKTIGKLLDSKVCVEGMVTICIRAMSDNGRHFFRTVTDGRDITKTPEDMFAEEEIENDLKVVDETIREYYGIKGEKA